MKSCRLRLCNSSIPLIKTENLPGTIEETASQYLQLIREIQPSGPYVLLGWCNGGTLAFEIARQLEEAGEVVSRVFLVDAWIPGYLKRLGWLRSKLARLQLPVGAHPDGLGDGPFRGKVLLELHCRSPNRATFFRRQARLPR